MSRTEKLDRKPVRDGGSGFLFVASNFYVTNVTVCDIIKNDISENDFCRNESIFKFYFVNILSIMKMIACKVDN